jgi:hypothetical protein
LSQDEGLFKYDIGAFEEVEGKVYLPLILKGY